MSHRYLVLGLLRQRAMSGYDIKKHVQGALDSVTNASYGTLYPTLHKLLAEGAVEVQEVSQKARPSKKVYRITEKGRQELVSWLREPAAADQIRREFLLKLYFAKDLPKKDLLTLIAFRKTEMQAMLDELRVELQDIEDPQRALVIDYTLSMYEAEVRWLSQYEKRIDAVTATGTGA